MAVPHIYYQTNHHTSEGVGFIGPLKLKGRQKRTVCSSQKEGHDVVRHPVVVNLYVLPIHRVEVELALLIQSFQTDEIVLVQSGLLQRQDLNVLPGPVEPEVCRLLWNNNLVLVEHHHHKVLQRLHLALVLVVEELQLVVDGCEIVRTGHVVGDVEGVVPVLGGGDEVLDPGHVGSGREKLPGHLTQLIEVGGLETLRDPEDSLVRRPEGDQVVYRHRTSLRQTSEDTSSGWRTELATFLIISPPWEIPTALYPSAISGSAWRSVVSGEVT